MVQHENDILLGAKQIHCHIHVTDTWCYSTSPVLFLSGVYVSSNGMLLKPQLKDEMSGFGVRALLSPLRSTQSQQRHPNFRSSCPGSRHCPVAPPLPPPSSNGRWGGVSCHGRPRAAALSAAVQRLPPPSARQLAPPWAPCTPG